MNTKNLSNSALTLPVAEDPAISKETKEFLAVLNAPGGPGLETLSPQDARMVLIGAQASVRSTIPVSKNLSRRY
jgi:acetyl esterase